MIPRLRLALVLFPVCLACGHGAAAQTADPPARVGRVARVSGAVSYRLAPDAAWQPAAVNLPVSAGTGIWTEPGAAAELGIGSIRLGADERTELDVTRLDYAELDVTAPQGRLCLHPFTLPPGTAAVVQTPRGAVRITAAGHYEIVAGDTAHPTSITVLDGSARVTGPAIDVAVGANQTATVDGDGGATPFRVALGGAVRSAFLEACLRRERPVPANRPAAVAQMTGWEALDEYGSWTPTPRYGTVWFPRDDPGYVPYRAGHWTFVPPWGWTWVDDAPWGFAPSHYGRWVQVDDRWGWVAVVPGLQPGFRPVYAPAVVGFLGGAAIGAVAGLSGGQPVGWVPLGPQEPYYPPYRVSNTYIRNVNVTNVTNITNVVQSFPRGAGPAVGGARVFVNANAATVAPAAAVQAGQQIAPVARPLPPGALRAATPPGQPPQPPGPGAVPAAAPGPAVADAIRGGRPVLRNLAAAPPPASPPAPGAERNAAPLPLPASGAGTASAPPAGAPAPRSPEVALPPSGELPGGPRPALAGPEAEHRAAPPNGPAGVPALRTPDAPRPAGAEPPHNPEAGPRPGLAGPEAEHRPAPPSGPAEAPALRAPDAPRPAGAEPPRGPEVGPRPDLAVPDAEHRPALPNGPAGAPPLHAPDVPRPAGVEPPHAPEAGHRPAPAAEHRPAPPNAPATAPIPRAPQAFRPPVGPARDDRFAPPPRPAPFHPAEPGGPRDLPHAAAASAQPPRPPPTHEPRRDFRMPAAAIGPGAVPRPQPGGAPRPPAHAEPPHAPPPPPHRGPDERGEPHR